LSRIDWRLNRAWISMQAGAYALAVRDFSSVFPLTSIECSFVFFSRKNVFKLNVFSNDCRCELLQVLMRIKCSSLLGMSQGVFLENVIF